MRILHVTPYYAPAWSWGGVVAAVTGLSRAQASAGHRVTVLTTDTLGPGRRGAAGRELVAGVEVWRVRTRLPALRARFNLSLPPAFRATARRLLGGGASEVVHCHELRTVETLIATREAVRAGVPVLLSPHGTLPRGTGRSALKAAWDALLAPRVLPRVDHVVALTEAEAEEAHRLWADCGRDLDGGRVSVVPNGVDPIALDETDRRAARRRLGIAADERVVLFLGRLHERKRVPLLVAAFAELAGRCDRARLIVAGPDAGGLGAVTAAIAAHRLADRVTVTGMVSGEQRLDALAVADVFALAGTGEGLPMAALEALSAGVPLVLGEACGLAEVAATGAGIIAGSDPASLAAALERVVLAPDAEAMRRRASRLARACFAWPEVVRRLDEIGRSVALPGRLAGAHA